MLPFLSISILVLLGTLDVTSSQTVTAGPPAVVQLSSQESGESSESATSSETDASSSSVEVANTLTVSSESQESQEKIASGDYNYETNTVPVTLAPTSEPPTAATVAADNRDRTASSGTNRPRTGEQVPSLPQQPFVVPAQPQQPQPQQPFVFPPQQPFVFPTQPQQPVFPTVQPVTQPVFTQPRTAGSCQANEHACPCAGGTYCLFRAAACLAPTVACPAEVLGTPVVGSNDDVMVTASWTAPASAVSVFGSPSTLPATTPYVRPAITSPPNFQFPPLSSTIFPASAPLYPMTSPLVSFPQFNSGPMFFQPSPIVTQPATFGPSFNFSQFPLTQGTMFGTPIATLPLSTGFFGQSQFLPTWTQPIQPINTGLYSSPWLSALPPNAFFANTLPALNSGLTIQGQSFQSTTNGVVAQPQVVRPAINAQPASGSGLTIQGQSFQSTNGAQLQGQPRSSAPTPQPFFAQAQPVSNFQPISNGMGQSVRPQPQVVG
jgi:hypothetical protein